MTQMENIRTCFRPAGSGRSRRVAVPQGQLFAAALYCDAFVNATFVAFRDGE